MKNSKKVAMLALLGALTAGGAFTAFAANQGYGQWCDGSADREKGSVWTNEEGQTVSSWWFAVSPDGKQCLANTWHWIKNQDGSIQCYYFDKDGWMVINGSIGDDKVDGNGIYVDASGNVVKGSENDVYYTASETFLNREESSGATSASDTTPAAGTGTGTVTGGTNTVSENKTVKVDSKGADPDSASVEFGMSTVTGTTSKTVTNEWANFTMTLTGFVNVEAGDGNSNMDFVATNDEGEISVQYYPLDLYTAGNTSFDAFVTEYLKHSRPGAMESGATAVKLVGDKELGGYTFKQIDRTHKIPINKTINYSTYLRQVEGTNYVMELYTKNSADSFASILNGMAKVR